MKQGVLERYRNYLPVTDATPMFTLGEGDTPLVKSRGIVNKVGCDELYFKLEGCNPTGSFKDRGMVVAVAKAIEAGGPSIVCASTCNTRAAAPAYGADSRTQPTLHPLMVCALATARVEGPRAHGPFCARPRRARSSAPSDSAWTNRSSP